jgi:hypothetical protein
MLCQEQNEKPGDYRVMYAYESNGESRREQGGRQTAALVFVPTRLEIFSHQQREAECCHGSPQLKGSRMRERA